MNAPNVVGVAEEVAHRLVRLGLVLGRHGGGVFDKEVDVLLPQRRELLACIVAVDTGDDAGDVVGVGVERRLGAGELLRPSAEGRAGGGRGEEDVFPQAGVQSW